METEAVELGRKEVGAVSQHLIDALSVRSVSRYQAPEFKSMADRDLFVVRFRSAFETEFKRPLGE